MGPPLPVGIFVPDLPVAKTFKLGLDDVQTNDGLHMNGIVACHRHGRLKDFLDHHFTKESQTYQLGNIRRIHVKRIENRHAYTAGYARSNTVGRRPLRPAASANRRSVGSRNDSSRSETLRPERQRRRPRLRPCHKPQPTRHRDDKRKRLE
jgi:hypothetical protein